MILRELIRQPVPVAIARATATVATPATLGPITPRSVAGVAGVAVAEPPGMITTDIPEDWHLGLAALRDGLTPVGLGEARWRELIADARRLATEWGERAHGVGWTALDLFGCSPGFARRLDRDGVAMLLSGRAVVALDAGAATIANRTGAPNVFRRRDTRGAVPIWQAMEKRK